jgi:hypothetical protein
MEKEGRQFPGNSREEDGGRMQDRRILASSHKDLDKEEKEVRYCFLSTFSCPVPPFAHGPIQPKEYVNVLLCTLVCVTEFTFSSSFLYFPPYLSIMNSPCRRPRP